MERPVLKLQSILAEDKSVSEENWMLSYIDVFVLMTTLFIMLVVINQPQQPGTIDTQPSLAAGPVDSIMQSLPDDVIDLVEAPAIQPALKIVPLSHQDWMAEIDTVINEHDLSHLVQLKKSEDFTELEIASRVLFDSGDAELTRPGEQVLETLLPILLTTAGDVFIEGHTDDQPIDTSTFPSNWELASARATSVLQFFVTEGLSRDRFRAVSYADTKPVAPNDSDRNRSKNRRVSLVIQRP